MKGLIDLLKSQVVFQGKRIYEDGLRYELKYHETASQCDNEKYMDVEVLDFPQLTLVVEPDRHSDWKPVGGMIGYASDGLGVFDSELVAGWVLKHMGFNIPVRQIYIDEESALYGKLTAGKQEDGRYFIPSADISIGYLLEWKADQDYYRCYNCQHVQHTTDFGECEECGYEDLVPVPFEDLEKTA